LFEATCLVFEFFRADCDLYFSEVENLLSPDLVLLIQLLPPDEKRFA